jgi:hypothetical protein
MVACLGSKQGWAQTDPLQSILDVVCQSWLKKCGPKNKGILKRLHRRGALMRLADKSAPGQGSLCHHRSTAREHRPYHSPSNCDCFRRLLPSGSRCLWRINHAQRGRGLVAATVVLFAAHLLGVPGSFFGIGWGRLSGVGRWPGDRRRGGHRRQRRRDDGGRRNCRCNAGSGWRGTYRGRSGVPTRRKPHGQCCDDQNDRANPPETSSATPEMAWTVYWLSGRINRPRACIHDFFTLCRVPSRARRRSPARPNPPGGRTGSSGHPDRRGLAPVAGARPSSVP